MRLMTIRLFDLARVCAALASSTACDVSAPATGRVEQSLTVESPMYDADGDGVGGVYDCNDEDARLPAECPLAAPEPGRPTWCDDGLAPPASRSLMSWANHLEMVDGREKGLREYLYNRDGQDQMPVQCDVALLAMRGGAQDANTEQLTRYVIDGLGPNSVGYVLGGRSFWPDNAEHWDFPNHAIDTSCLSADGRTRLGDVHQSCSTALALRRISPWDPCGSQYAGNAILIGGGQSATEYPKANLIQALNTALEQGLLGEVNRVIDIDSLDWSNACRAGLGARGCCHAANRVQEYSGQRGVQVMIPTAILTYGPVCKNMDDLLHKYECSDLSKHAPLQAFGGVLRAVLGQSNSVAELIARGASPSEVLALGPLSEQSLLAVLQSGWKSKDILAVLRANYPLTDRVLLLAAERLDHAKYIAEVLNESSPLSVSVMLAALRELDKAHELGDVLLVNSPKLPDSVIDGLLAEVDQKKVLEAVLLANSPGLSDLNLLGAIEQLGSDGDLVEVLLANCPLSGDVRAAAKRKLGSKHWEALAQCGGS